ncbi:MAG TPA: glycoside hydrolase family 2 TIM barrel-domain containing protein, partial [Prolixibacteraceae bacterium]|nr:glycoside hydrolase family 2 TIM barrel-domain containing protein [Prolixibacteraceae bacterium]
HEGGTFITTPVANDSVAVVQVKTWIRNNGNSPRNVRLVTTLTHTFGLIIEKIETEKRIMPGETALFTQHSQPMKSPRLWSPDRPYFYNAFSEVYVENRLSDFFHTLFGIRYFHWDYDQHRLVLNGKPIQLHGINRHEEYVWLGAAFPDWIAERDMDDIRFGLEANFMRTAHYPQDPSIYSYTDTRGICINEELPNIKKLPFNDTIQERNCREMIRRDRNHPSILFWSMGNETDDACDSRIAVQEDTTRILTVRQPYNLSYNPEFVKHTDKEMPLESFLRCTIKGWYDRDDKSLEPEDNQWAGTEEWQHTLSAQSTISEHNGAVWLYADHGADREYTNAPLKHVNPKGWVDSWRNPKYAYYQWQANFAKTPMVFIHPHFWRKQYLGQKKDFVVDSNAGKVELWKNGKSLGVLKPDKSNNFCVTFREVEVEEGFLEAIIETASGDKIRHRLDMAGDPYALKIDHFNIIMESTPDHVNELNIDIVDKNGIHVTGASNTLKFKVEGPATLVGPEVYVSDRDKKEAWEGTMYIDAPVTNLIRATGKTGKVRFTASSPGLLPASCEIEVVPWVDPCPVNGITEPPLNPEGRLPVRVNPGMANFTKVPEEMKNHPGEIRFPA